MDLNSFWVIFTLLYFGKAVNHAEILEGVLGLVLLVVSVRNRNAEIQALILQ